MNIANAEEFAALCDKIYAAPKPLLEAANPKWIVHDRFIRPSQPGTQGGLQYMALMQSEKDDMRINACHYAFAGNTSYAPDPPPPKSTERLLHCYFGFFLEYGAGTGNANSEQEFRANINRAIWTFFENPWLGLETEPKNPVSKHRQLIVPPRVQVIPMGDRWTYWAEGAMAVEMQRFNRGS